MAKNVKTKTDEKYRSRNFELMIYPDNPEHVKAFEYVKKYIDEYAYILHDRDVSADGTTKKEHWHIVLRFKNAIWNTALSKILNLEERFIQDVKNFDRCLQYLIHYNEPTKYQYDITDVHGMLAKRLQFTLTKGEKSLEEKVDNIVQYIEMCPKRITITQMIKYVNKNDLYGTFRQGFAIYSRIIEEHNYFVSQQESSAFFAQINNEDVPSLYDEKGFVPYCNHDTGELHMTPFDAQSQDVSRETFVQQKLTLGEKENEDKV